MNKNTCMHKLRKFVLALFLVFIILNIICLFYYNLPIHIKQVNGATDYVWPPNSKWSRLTEGYSFGKMDSNGYNNLFVIDHPNILLMGSSHMEGMEVLQKDTTSYKLSEKLNKSVYNIGISGHTFAHILNNLEDALKTYQPTEYVIIETQSIDFNNIEIKLALEHKLNKLTSVNKGIIYQLQKSPFLRLMWFQYQNIKNLKTKPISVDEIEKQEIDYDVITKYISEICERYNVLPVIFLQAPFSFDNNGYKESYRNELQSNIFFDSCQKNNIIFIDFSSEFQKKFENEKKVPHGFVTGEVEKGHLNKDGHEIIANRLYEEIIKLERLK